MAGVAGGALAAGAPATRRAGARTPDADDGAGALVYVGTYTTDARREGVYAFRVDPRTGAWRPAGAFDVGPNPSFLAAAPGGVLYAVNEVEHSGGEASGQVRALAAGAGGALAPLGTPQLTGGGAPCYVSAAGGRGGAGASLLVANYAGGSVARLPLGAGGEVLGAAAVARHAGRGPRADRQDAPHAHCILPDPTGRWAVAADLGTDQVLVYRLDAPGLAPASAFAMPPGAGPRHLAFAPGGRVLYVVGELDRTLTALRFDPAAGTLTSAGPAVLLADGPGAPAPAAGERTAAHVQVAPSGRFAYASVRGDDLLVVLALDPATRAPAVVQRIPTGGRWPRHFALDPAGRMLYVANQRSDGVAAFAVDAATGRLAPAGARAAVPSPVCVCFARTA